MSGKRRIEWNVEGAWSVETPFGFTRVSSEMTRQATMIGLASAFMLYSVMSALAVPLCLHVRPPRKAAQGAGPPPPLSSRYPCRARGSPGAGALARWPQ
jgi:hypothetical protein